MPLKELLDPQGKAVLGGLQQLGLDAVSSVRVGKQIQLEIEAKDPAEAESIATIAAKKLLANSVMEVFEVSVS